MREIKRIFALCIAALLMLLAGCTAAVSDNDSVNGELTEASLEKKTTYRLHIAEPQRVGREVEMSANPAYFLQKSIRTDKEYMLVELCVDKNDKVTSGQLLAILQGTGSVVDAQQKRLEKNAYAANAAEMETYYAGLLSAARALPNDTETEKEIRRLNIEYASAEYELYKLQTSNMINIMEQEIAAMEANAGEVYIYAPTDGTVRTMNTKFKEGDLIPAGTELYVINDADSQCIYGLSGSGAFVYGREVEVELGKGDNKQIYIGKVVSSPEVQPGEYYNTDIYIKLDEEINFRTTDGKAAMSYTVLDNVIAVPSNAISVQDGIASLQILEGENVRTRSIVRGPAAGGTVTVLQGLELGDQVVVSSYNS